MITLTSTTHAYRRARERLRWPRRAVDRMLNRIFYDGLGPSECPAVLDIERSALSHHFRPPSLQRSKLSVRR